MAQGVLLILIGVWLLLQTLVGGLPQRVLSWRNWSPKAAEAGKVSGSAKTNDVTGTWV